MTTESLLSPEELIQIESTFDATFHQRVLEFQRARKLIFLATNMALKSAFGVGLDMPVGAVASFENVVTGKGMASDNLTGQRTDHAERIAIINSREYTEAPDGVQPNTIGVTMEPCPMCQDFIAENRNIKTVVFAMTRRDAEQRGLVRRHPEDIFGRAERVGLPFNIMHLTDPRLTIANEYLLDFTRRNHKTGSIKYLNDIGLSRAIQSLNNIFPGEPAFDSHYDELVAKKLEPTLPSWA